MMKQAVVDRKCPRVPPDVPEPFARIILQCLQVSPQRRPTAFAVMEVCSLTGSKPFSTDLTSDQSSGQLQDSF